MKVKELIKELAKYNSEAEVQAVAHCKSQIFSISYGSDEGCTKENCDHVSFYLDELCINEKSLNELAGDGNLIKGQESSTEKYVSEKLSYEDAVERIIELEKRLEYIGPLTEKDLPYDKDDESTWVKDKIN